MAFWAIIWKAIKIRRAIQRLKFVKLNAYRESIGLRPLRPWYLIPLFWAFSFVKWILLSTCCACLRKGKSDKLNKWDLLWTNGTLSNKILKSFLGIICGLIAGTVSLLFFFRQLNFQPILSLVISMMIGSVLSFGLAFSQKMRCVYFLVIPQFFSEKGRTAILGCALILAISGPGKNTAHNMEVLSDSLICTQEMVKESMGDLVKLAKSPYTTLKEIFKNILSSLASIGKYITGGVEQLVNTIVRVVNTIKEGIAWLKGIVNVCKEDTGKPFDRCMKAFNEASEDCVDKLGSWFSWMCFPVDALKHLCHLAKVVDVICMLPKLIDEYIFSPIVKHVSRITNQIKIFFRFKPIFKHEFKHNLNSSKSFKAIAAAMKEDVLRHVRWVYEYFDILDLAISAFLLLVIWKSFLYLRGYLNSDRYDNRYITKGLVRMDLQRKKVGKESIFPLKIRESKIYITVSSLMLLKDEWKKLRRSLFFVALSSANILLYIFMDFGLYLFMELMGEYGNIQLDTRGWLGHGAEVAGDGILADIYRIILKGLSPVAAVMPQFDTQPCLPEPQSPDYLMYSVIVFLILLAFFAAVTEPYGLRFRHAICGMYFPHRKIPRDRYLLIHIISSRDSFLTFARRKIKSKINGDSGIYQVSFFERMSHKYACCRSLVWFLSGKKKKCFLCGVKGDMEDHENFLHCPTCDTVYCVYCYADLEDICTACMKPVDYGDLSDISEESGSDSGRSGQDSADDLNDESSNRRSVTAIKYSRDFGGEGEDETDDEYLSTESDFYSTNIVESGSNTVYDEIPDDDE